MLSKTNTKNRLRLILVHSWVLAQQLNTFHREGGYVQFKVVGIGMLSMDGNVR